MKKWIIRILATMLFLFLGVIIYVELNKERLVALAVDEANQSIDGSITYDGSDISLLSTFPNIGIRLHNVIVRDALMKEDIPLVNLDEFSIEVDFMSVLRKDLTVNAFKLINGTIYLSDYLDGTNNYSLLRETDNTKSVSQSADFRIERFTFKKLDIVYRSEIDKSRYTIEDFSNQGKLKYKDSWIILENDLEGVIKLELASMLPSYALDLSGKMKNMINPAMDSITIDRADITANDLPLLLNGTVTLGESVQYKFDFSSPSTEIKRLVSLLPNFYKNRYKDLIGTGTYVLSGEVNGSTTQDYPLFKVSVMAQDGSLSYPDLNAKIDRFGFSLIAENNNANTPYSRMIINNINLVSGASKLTGNFTSIADRAQHKVNTDLDVNLILEDIAKSLVLSPDTELLGSINGLVKGNGMLDLDAQTIRSADERLNLDLALDNIRYKDSSFDLAVAKGSIKGDEVAVNFDITGLDYNQSIQADIVGQIEKPLAALLNDSAEITGGINVIAELINLNALSANTDTSISVSNVEIPRVNFNYSFEADKIIQSEYEFNSVKATGNLRNASSAVDFSVNEFRGSTLTGNGNLENVLDYGINGAILGGNLNVVSDQLDLNNFISAESSSSSAIGNDLIPDNIDLDIDYESGGIKFRNIDIAESLGKLSIKDKKVIIETKGNIFGGKVGVVGTFDNTKDEGYHIDFQLDLKELQFAETAARLKLFRQLIPVAKLLEGEYSATLNWNSDLDNNYMPDLNSLSAYGLIETKNSGITSSLPIDSFIRKLNIIDTKSTQLKLIDAKEYFIVENGHVMLKDLGMQLEDVDIQMSGSHSFAQDLNYKLKIDIPKSKLKIDGLLGSLQDKLQFSDILKGATDDVKVQVEALMHGTVLHPKFKITGVNLKRGSVVESLQDQIVTSVEEIKDSIVTEIRDTIDAVISQGEDLIDSAKTVVTETIDSFEQVVTEIIDSTKDWATGEVEELKDTLSKEGEVLLQDILTGNTDSLDFNIDDIFLGKQSQLDSLAKKFPIGLFGAKAKKKKQE